MPDVPRETQKYLSSLYCQSLTQLRDLLLPQGRTWLSGPVALLLTQSLPVPHSLYNVPVWVLPQEPLPYTQRPCHVWDSTDFSLGSGQRDLGAALTLRQRPEEPPTPSSRHSPRHLSITSNFVSPVWLKITVGQELHCPGMIPDFAPSLLQPQFTLQKQLWQGCLSVSLTCWDRDQLEGSQRILKGKMECSGMSDSLVTLDWGAGAAAW